MGNIKTMNRNGKTGSSSWGEVDKLAYSYINSGNKLQKVDDTGANASAGGFKDGNGGTDYGYTNAGKITSDLNKGISLIEYNFQDLISKITKTNADYIEFKYNTLGQKIATKSNIGGQISYKRYNGDFVYSSSSDVASTFNVDEIQYQEGRFNNGVFEYSYVDHAGNLRLNFKDNTTTNQSEILQETAFDPWGLPLDGLEYYNNIANKDAYDWQRKENLENFGLQGFTNFGWRIQDRTIGRWLGPDPLDQFEDVSSYGYCLNNPVVYQDEDGRFIPFVIAAVVGGGANLWSNWGKVKNFKQGLAYFGSGAIGGAVSVVNPLLGGSITSGGNVGIDIATGNMPKFNNGWDVAKYGAGIALDGIGAAGAGKLGKMVGGKIASYFGAEAIVSGGNTIEYSAQVGQKVLAGTEVIGDIAEVTVKPMVKGWGGNVVAQGLKQTLQKTVNLNTNAAKGNFGIYEIIMDGQVYKYGKADLGRITQSSGLPTRLHQQLVKLQELNPNSRVFGRVIDDLGNVTTKQAKIVEKAYLDFFYKTNNKSIPLGNIKSYFGR
jgi:RHS repeat-associated protein